MRQSASASTGSPGMKVKLEYQSANIFHNSELPKKSARALGFSRFGLAPVPLGESGLHWSPSQFMGPTWALRQPSRIPNLLAGLVSAPEG